MNRQFFGTDGIRGLVGVEPISPERILKLGWAAGRVLAGKGGGSVVIGKDTRISGYLLESALEAGFSAAGVNVSLLGPMPTPAIAYLTQTARADAGVVISASHNKFHDNGIKFFSSSGTKLPDEIELEIERYIDGPLETVTPSALGKARRYPHAAGRYIEFCKATVDQCVAFNGLKVVIDCANGATYHVAPPVFEELGCQVQAMGVTPDGININHECGSTHPQALQQQVVESGADIGIALDGDGDRCLLVDAKGQIIDGDQILYILAKARHTAGTLQGGVAGTLMSNLGLERALGDLKIPFVRTAVGDRYILEYMAGKGWELGGEASGHILCRDKTTTGDGIIAALQVLQQMMVSGKTLEELAEGMDIYPQVMINVEIETKLGIQPLELIQSEVVKKALDEAEAELNSRGRIVLRPSGTEPLIRVMVEGESKEMIDRVAKAIADNVAQAARLGAP
ncbi:MAG: phosphoglucosamine mutase [Arenicellales bacterium]|jgi:phosphoglucosamine mutase|nr:phosphoglucosamine mutase [Arenicellales bacterium]MDP6290076.1 phosphoglucosamine mutase [Arenicellales bacterium]MDP7155873.1 phosphoglucosamine mutase [Arenicellales bacterium]MDP7283600.1 phosphoglucosamine mutase [Arenicellales bacterium]MDP7481617.1 phosphoglucosamine mutase [Arenicellales bacterium]|tara:strand:+ start:4421 stop:5785 length:1365 start_codon:yes stop_codon:yes gene_type:complete